MIEYMLCMQKAQFQSQGTETLSSHCQPVSTITNRYTHPLTQCKVATPMCNSVQSYVQLGWIEQGTMITIRAQPEAGLLRSKFYYSQWNLHRGKAIIQCILSQE